jgi:hypothetical protein
MKLSTGASRAALAFLALLLAACETRDTSQCPADFAGYGREEALRGEPASLPGPGCDPTAEDLASYQAGRAAGQARYCTAEQGYRIGLDGGEARPEVCAEEQQAELKRGFEVGSQLRQHLAERDRLRAQADEAERVAAKLPEGSVDRRRLEDEAARLRFDARQRENDVEALRGVAAVEQWR